MHVLYQATDDFIVEVKLLKILANVQTLEQN